MTARTETQPPAPAGPTDQQRVVQIFEQLMILANQMMALPEPTRPSGRVVANAFVCATTALLSDARLVDNASALHWLDLAREQVAMSSKDQQSRLDS